MRSMLNEYLESDLSEKQIRKLQRDLWVTRILMTFCSLLMIVILAGGYYLYQVVQVYVKQAEGYVTEVVTYAEGMKSALTQIQGVDMEALCRTFTDLSAALEGVDFALLADQLETLDVEAINTKLDSLDIEKINEKLDSLDMDAINAKLDTLDLETLNAKIYALDVDKINDTMGSIDTKVFSEALADLNAAVDTVEDLSAKLQQVALIFQ